MIRPYIAVRRIEYDFTDFDLHQFLAYLEMLVDHKIRLKFIDMPNSCFGALGYKIVRGLKTFYIFVNQDLEGMHKFHTIFHEVGHLLLKHPQILVNDENDSHEIVKNLPNRSLFGTWYEHEAEQVAMFLQEKIKETNIIDSDYYEIFVERLGT